VHPERKRGFGRVRGASRRRTLARPRRGVKKPCRARALQRFYVALTAVVAGRCVARSRRFEGGGYWPPVCLCQVAMSK